MRKQVLIGMMLLTLGAGLVGCGKSETNKTENNTTTVAGGSQVADASTEAKKEETKVDTSDWFYCSIDTQARVYYPRYYSWRKNSGTILYSEDSTYQIVVNTDFGDNDKLSENNFNDIFDYFLKNIGETYFLDFGALKLLGGVKTECVAKESCKVNGQDAFRYTAKTTGAKNNKESYVYGYLSTTPKTNFTIYGVIIDESQVDSDSVKQKIRTEVDAIMNTFETK